DEFDHPFFRFRLEVTFNVQFTEQFAEVTVDCAAHTLPARRKLFLTTEYACEGEVSLHEIIAEVWGSTLNNVPLKVCFPVGKRNRRKQCVRRLEKCGVVRNQTVSACNLELLQHTVPVYRRRGCREIPDRKLVICFLRIAEFNTRHLHFRKRGFNTDYRFSFRCSLSFVASRELEHLVEVR